MRDRHRITLCISLLLFCWTPKGSAQAAYTVTDLGTLPGGNLSRGYGINNSGQATGFSRIDSSGDFDAFLYSTGTMADLGTLGGGSHATSVGHGINDSGQVTGTSTPNNANGEHAFLYSAGSMTDLGTLGGGGCSFCTSEGYGVNNSGQVTGTSGSAAFFYSAGSMTDLGTLDTGNMAASGGSGINDSGQVTGYSTTNGTGGADHAFLYSSSTGMVDLGTLPGSATSSGYAINAFGQVTGGPGPGSAQGDAFLYSSGTGMVDLGTLPGGTLSVGLGINAFAQVAGASTVANGGPTHAILYTSTQGMVDLNTLIPPGSGWGLAQAYGINNAGQIVGWGGINGATHAFLLTPNGLITPQEMPCGCGASNPSEPQVAGAQGKQGDPVSTAFGSFSESFNDVSVSGRGLSLSFDHSYSSVFGSFNGPLGYGWTHNYTMRLIQQGTSLVVAQENGSRVTFNAASGGGYTAPPRMIATLVKNSDGTFTFTRRAQEFFTFSATGQLTSERDRNGYVTSLTYNGSGQLTSVTDPAGRTLTLTYNGSGQLITVTDPIGRQVSFAYDSNGNLATVTDVNGGKTSFTYSASHLLLTITDPRGGVVTNTYDTSNRVTSQSDQLKRKTTFAYASGTTTTTDPKGNVTKEEYNQLNQRVSLTKGFGTSSAATWTFTYDSNTQGLATTTDPNGHVSSTTYDASGNPLTSTDGLGRVTAQTWDSMNDLTSVKDPLTVTTTNTYDANGNLLTRSTPLTGTGKIQTYTYQYGVSTHPGDLTGMVDPDGRTTTFTYDSDGNQITATDPLGHTTKFAYNGIGWKTSITDARGKTTSYTRNSFGDLTVTADALGHKVTRSYDANRNLISLKDDDGDVTAFTYDVANERTKTTRADGTALQTVYNADGTVSKTIDGAGDATNQGYDSLARPISVTDPLGRTTKYSYDRAGNLIKVTDPSGQITTNTYDPANELTRIAYSDGKTPNVTIVYDADGQRTSMTDGTGTSKWTYDTLHRVATTTTGAGAKVSYAYDLKGQLTKLTYPGGTHIVSRIYDAAGRLTSITDWLGNNSAFVYDPDGNLTSETLPSTTGITSNLSYDAASRLTGVVDAKGSTNLATFSYTLDADGQLTGATETGVPLSGTDTYGYTKLNQLATFNSSSYSYDDADNVTGLITPSQVQLKYDSANELTTLTAGSASTTFVYDKRGNRLSRTPNAGQGMTYAYDQANRMTGFGSADIYAYAGEGLRMAKTVSGKTEVFTWDRSGSLPLLIADGTTSYIYDPQGMPLEQVSGSDTALFYLHDQLGSTRLVTNSSGAVQASYTYDAYGNLLGNTGTVANPFGYAGQYTDSESGLIYMRARYHDPATAQFTSRDPLVNFTGEAYVYVNDNPINGVDPTGLWTWQQTWTAIQTFGTTFGTAVTTHAAVPIVCTSAQDVKDWAAFVVTVTVATALNDLALGGPYNATEQTAVDNLALALQDLQAHHPGKSPATLLNGSAIFQQVEIAAGKFRPQHH